MSANLGSVLADMLSGLTREIARGQGPVKWCQRCGRKHPRRAGCGLSEATVTTRKGRLVKRQVRPPLDS